MFDAFLFFFKLFIKLVVIWTVLYIIYSYLFNPYNDIKISNIKIPVFRNFMWKICKKI